MDGGASRRIASLANSGKIEGFTGTESPVYPYIYMHYNEWNAHSTEYITVRRWIYASRNY
jgi:hypothetical protein